MNATRIEALFQAIEAGAVSSVTAMLDAEPAAIDVFGDGNRLYRDKTPLMYALQCNHFHLAGLLLARGANAKAHMRDEPMSTVIALAVRFVVAGNSNRDMVVFVGKLIDAGADPSDALWPALHAYHRKFDQPELIELLLQRGADPDRAIGTSTVRALVQVNASLYSRRVLELFGL